MSSRGCGYECTQTDPPMTCCAENLQDPYNPELCPDYQHPIPCCNNHKKIQQNSGYICPDLPCCAPQGADPYSTNVCPNLSSQTAAPCCDGQEKKQVGNVYVCPGSPPDPSVTINGQFPILKKFDTSSLDDWNILDNKSDCNWTNSCAYYVKDAVSNKGSTTVLSVTDVSDDGKSLKSGRCYSKEQFSYGIYEFNVDMPKCNQVFPALWLLPITSSKYAEGNWPCQGEIDIVETTDSMPWGTFNIVAGTGKNGACNNCVAPDYELQSTMISDWPGSRMYVGDVNCSSGNKQWGLHKYVLYWEPGRLISYVDPILTKDSNGNITSIIPNDKTDPSEPSIKSYKVYTINNTPTWKAANAWLQQCYGAGPYAPFDSQYNIVLNIAIGGYGGATCGCGSVNCGDICGNAVGSKLILHELNVYSLPPPQNLYSNSFSLMFPEY